MTTITTREFKANIPGITKQVKTGESFEVIDDETRVVIGYFVKENPNADKHSLEILEEKATL